MKRRLDLVPRPADDGTLRVVVVEHPDPSGDRWRAALDLLLEAGREDLARSA